MASEEVNQETVHNISCKEGKEGKGRRGGKGKGKGKKGRKKGRKGKKGGKGKNRGIPVMGEKQKWQYIGLLAE